MHDVVVAALIRDDRVLLVHRRPTRHAYPDVWDLLVGHIERGETELVALAREMREELDIQIASESAVSLCRLDAGRVGDAVRHTVWLVSRWHGVPTNAKPDEHDRIRWFTSEEVPPLAHDRLRPVLIEAMRRNRT